MRNTITRSLCITLGLLVAVVSGAAAQALPPEVESGDEESYSLGLGVAGMAIQQPYTGIGRDYMPVPVIYFENRWIQLSGVTLDFKLPGISWSGGQSLSFGARIEYDGSGYKQGEAGILDGMAERKSGILAGAVATWETPLLSVSAAAMFDASSASKGRRFSIGLERSFSVGEHVMITPSVETIQLDKKYSNYYFGVLPGEVRVGRDTYMPGSTLNASLGVRTEYFWGSHHALFLQAEYTALGKEITRSPLIDRSGDSMLFMGYIFGF